MVDINQQVMPFVDGGMNSSESEQTTDVIDPSTGRRLMSIPVGSGVDVDRAVASARRSFDFGSWRNIQPSHRKRILIQWADLIGSHAATLDALDAGEMGKPIREHFCSALAAADLLRFYAEAVDKVTGDVYAGHVGSYVSSRRVPRGVVAAIVPWNFPTYNAVLKCAPALAAGNSVILKPSELSSRSAILIAELGVRAGIPPGVLNVVPGLGASVGRCLGLHVDVDMVTFTGSTEVGKLMLQYAGQSNMKVVVAECGGKSPQIVFDDGVDLEVASKSIAELITVNQGQLCSAGSRLLVHRSIETEILERICARFEQIEIGPPLSSRTTFGPLVSAAQCARVMDYISTASNEGAQLVTGGRRVYEHTGGYFVEPTVFRNVSPQARIAREEIFGPVLSVMTFDHESEAVRIANETMYGLMAYVWTSGLARGMRLAREIHSSIRIHSGTSQGEYASHAPSFEPMRQSGIGIEGGMPGLEGYMRRQLVWFSHD